MKMLRPSRISVGRGFFINLTALVALVIAGAIFLRIGLGTLPEDFVDRLPAMSVGIPLCAVACGAIMAYTRERQRRTSWRYDGRGVEVRKDDRTVRSISWDNVRRIKHRKSRVVLRIADEAFPISISGIPASDYNELLEEWRAHSSKK